MCDCREKIRKSILAKDTNNTGVYFDLANIAEWEDGKKIVENKTGQGIEVYYNHTKRDGSVVKKSRKSFVGHDFCPWCGNKYNPKP